LGHRQKLFPVLALFHSLRKRAALIRVRPVF
jgi:hypothetical protein